VFCGPVAANIEHMQEFAARGVNRFVWTVWSPPGWMKFSGLASGPADGAPSCSSTLSKLDPAHNTDSANFVRDYLPHMRDGSGVEPYAVSIANEPRFTQPFNNCVWDPPSYRDALKIVGPIVKARFPGIRFLGTEAMFWEVNNWLGTMLGDATARQHLDAVAGHYGGSGDYSSTWGQASGYGKAVWGSEEETDEDESGIGAALTQAGRLHYALVDGSASAWIGWVLASLTPGGDETRALHWICFGAKHFFRVVRPDAIRIGCSGGSGSLCVSAYKHNGDNTVTVVVVNTGGSASIRLQGSGLPASLNMYQTDASHQCANTGTVQTSNSISIPGSGIVTLYSGDITNIPPCGRNEPTAGAAHVRVAHVKVYTLDGRLVGPGVTTPRTGLCVIREGRSTKPSLTLQGCK
jgi:glucuronoarabinoxylan endo-1,4-beta-xylanase